MNYSKNILLTGAGFTKNFGGFLAEEMWAQIFNHTEVQKNWELVEKMQEQFDYENIYYEIMQGDKPYKQALHIATMKAYENLDSAMRDWVPGSGKKDGIYVLLDLFSGKADEVSCFFTLNQDLLIERCFSGGDVGVRLSKEFDLPGIDMEFRKLRSINPLTKEEFISLPKDTVDFKLSTKKFNYIKLHGSCNWKSHDGSDAMVIGLNKQEAIEKEPLLKKYCAIFKDAISQKGVRLLVIGYGFGDDHINEIIYEAIKSVENDNEKLKLYVLSPEAPGSFKKKLYESKTKGMCEFFKPKGITIFSRLSGYFQCYLKDDFMSYYYNYGSRPYFKMVKEIFV